MPDAQTKPTCQFLKANGEYCKKRVGRGESRCYWHASGFKAKVKSLERSHKVVFWMGVVALAATLGFGALDVVWHYHARNTPTNITGISSGDNSPNIIDNHGSVTIQSQRDSNSTGKSNKESGEKK
jgi:hypothetical protein